MKKYLSMVLGLALVAIFAGQVFAAKPDTNKASAQTIDWNLSADVMPVPPYGSRDIPDSDTLSKLIVNQPNGNTEAAITGVMKGLKPNTTYTVYLSKEYTPYSEFWDVTGTWGIAINYLGNDYVHDTTITKIGNSLEGFLVYPGNTKKITSGTVTGNTITIVAEYVQNVPGTVTLNGTIDSNGMMSGTWSDTWGGLDRSGTWSTTGGPATKITSGSLGWPGLLSEKIPAFTFSTDDLGAGSWHINLKKSLGITGEKSMSVWINGDGATLLISDPFSVTF